MLGTAEIFGQPIYLSAQGRERPQNVAKIKEKMIKPLPKLQYLQETENLNV
jgi:hypothetical protein